MTEAVLTRERLAEVRMRLERTIGRKDEALLRAKVALDTGDLGTARQEMADAVRNHRLRLQRYDTGGRFAAQTQELVHLRTKLLRGTMRESLKKLFSRYDQIGQETAKDLDVKIVKGIGTVAAGIAASTRAVFMKGADTPFVATAMTAGYAALGASRLYPAVKTAIRAIYDKAARHEMCKVYRSVRQHVADVAENVRSWTIKTAVTGTATSGFSLARGVASMATSLGAIGNKTVELAKKCWNWLTA